VFVGGTDEFKLGPAAAELAREARRRGLHVHWGRVNSRKRIRYIAETGAADSFDGSPWATLRLAAVNQRTIDRARAAGRVVPAAIRKLDQGLAWCLEVAREAAAQAPAFVAPDGRVIPAMAGGSPELDKPSDDELVERYRRREASRIDGLTPEQRAALADYEVLARYDRHRACRYGDMANTRRGRELNRLAGRLIDAGVPVDRDGRFPTSTPAELVAAFERVGRPRLRRLERETAPVTLPDGTVYAGRLTRYNGTSLGSWRAIEAALVHDARHDVADHLEAYAEGVQENIADDDARDHDAELDGEPRPLYPVVEDYLADADRIRRGDLPAHDLTLEVLVAEGDVPATADDPAAFIALVRRLVERR